jgi:hypothetical protein
VIQNQKYAEGQRKLLFPNTGVLNHPGEHAVIDSLETGVSYGYCKPSPKVYSQYRSKEDVAEGYGEEHPTGPNVSVQPVEKVGCQDSGDDHDGGKLVLVDVVAIRPGSGHRVGVQDDEVNDRRLRM